MKVLLTGATGFLGWHTRVRLKALTQHEVIAVSRADWPNLARLAKGADAIVHVAGINRGTPEEVEMGNIRLARDVAAAAGASGTPTRIVFANSIQSGNDSPYGTGKAKASDHLAVAAESLGSAYFDARLPNLFGEHGRPNYNSFVATFVELVVKSRAPQITDRPVALLHAQRAAQSLIDGLTSGDRQVEPAGNAVNVATVLEKLTMFHEIYTSRGDIPPLITEFDAQLFNTLRSRLFPRIYPIPLVSHPDGRGNLVETTRSHGGPSQTFLSSTRPGVTRGEHFHLGLVERFIVIGGNARISLRKIFTSQVISFEVSGNDPAVIDMPTLWAHNIINTGNEDLTTLFWANRLYDASTPDTYPENVGGRNRNGIKRATPTRNYQL
jgi:UDP-2-acetamido-2,6-beta-L-arabino-hexul-4-ose reductase